MTIRNKMLLWFLLPVILIGASIAVVCYLHTQEIVKRNIFNQLNTVADDLRERVHLFLHEKKGRTLDFSSDGFIRDCTEEIVVRESRKEYYTTVLNEHLDVNKKPLDPDILHVFVVGLDGTVISSTETGNIGRDVSDKVYFSKTMKRGSCVSDLHYVPGLKQNTFEVARLLVSKREQKPIGIIVNQYNGDSIRRVTRSGVTEESGQIEQREGLEDTGEFYIVNRDNLMITLSRFTKDTILKQVVDTEGVRAVLEGRVGMIGIYPDYRGVSVLGVSKYFEEMDWVILAEKEVSEALKPIVRLRNFTIIMGITGIMVIVVVAIFISRGITRPIKRLVTSANVIAEGDLTGPIRVKSNDEVGSLASSFDTMRIKINELLKSNEEAKNDWESTFDSIEDIITLFDKDNRLIRYNIALTSNLNIAPEYITDEKCYDLDHKNNDYLLEGHLIEIARNKNPVTIEVEEPAIDCIFSISNFPRYNNNGGFIGTVQITRDITERKRAEDKLREANNFNQSLINALPFGMDIVDEEGNILYLSKMLESTLGKGVIGKKCWNVYCDDKKMCKMCPLEKDNKTKGAKTIISEGVFGGKIFQITHVSIMYKGKWAILEIFNNISELKRTEKELRESHMEINQVLASVPSILISVDSEDRITRWNASADKIFGIPAIRVVRRSFRECGIKWDWDEITKLISRCRIKHEPSRLDDIRYLREDNKYGFLGITINPIAGNSNGDHGFLLLGADITERKIMENKLLHSQKLESIGELAAGIAHEINTPTQYIRDNTSFLKDSFSDMIRLQEKYSRLLEANKSGPVTPEIIKEVDTVVEETDVEYLTEEIPKAIEQSMDGLGRVAEIVRAMKDFSHPDEQEKKVVDINKAIESTITVARGEWKYVAEMETDFDTKLPEIPCFPGDFNQVVLNMIVNAAHAINDTIDNGESENGKIRISTRHDGDWVEICISDTGAGIPEEIRTRIFDQFFTTKDVGKGTGQGLAIAHSVVVEKHKGIITFNSEVGKGTTFIIRLPIT